MASPEKALTDKVWTDKRFAGRRVADLGPYLFQDLRIVLEALRALDTKRLEAICQAYGSPKIGNLLGFLRRKGSGEAGQ